MFRIATSTLTLAEVHKPRHGTALSKGQDTRIVAYFEHDFIDLVQVDRLAWIIHEVAAGRSAALWSRCCSIPQP